MEHTHIVPPKVYFRTYLLLLLFMTLTIVAYVVHLPNLILSNAVAMAIALTKAVLVVLYFMQVKYATKLTWLWAALGFIWLGIMFTIVTDYYTRGWVHIAGW